MAVKPKTILVIQTAFLGDVVLTTPLLTALKEYFPNASLSVLVIPRTQEALSRHPAVDEVLTYDKKGAQRGIRSLFQLARLIKTRGFDLCFLPHRSFRSAALAWFSGIPRRIGFRQSLGAIFLTDRVNRDLNQHEVDRNLSLLTSLGMKPMARSYLPQVAIDAAARESVERILKTEGAATEDYLIGIAPGSVWATKRWMPEGFSALVDSLAEKYNAKVILLGSRDDEPIGKSILKLCRTKPLNLLGQSIQELIATLSRCRLLITNDNGAMHIAGALGIPIVAIFGSTSPQAGYGPYSPLAQIVEHSLPCRPCGLHGYHRCPQGHFRCMREITSEEVLSSVEKQLKIVRGIDDVKR